MKYVAVLSLSLVSQASSAQTASVQECQVRVVQPLIDDLGNHWQPGQVLAVTIERDYASGGAYCASGGSCLPRKVNGSDAVRLLNCRTGASLGGGDHGLVPDPHRIGTAAAQAMRTRNQVEQSLSKLGFSNASASGLADEYLTNPQSSTGRLIARALAGSSAATATLKRNNP